MGRRGDLRERHPGPLARFRGRGRARHFPNRTGHRWLSAGARAAERLRAGGGAWGEGGGGDRAGGGAEQGGSDLGTAAPHQPWGQRGPGPGRAEPGGGAATPGPAAPAHPAAPPPIGREPRGGDEAAGPGAAGRGRGQRRAGRVGGEKRRESQIAAASHRSSTARLPGCGPVAQGAPTHSAVATARTMRGGEGMGGTGRGHWQGARAGSA